MTEQAPPVSISDEEVARLRDLKIAIALATANAERAASELRATQLERRNFILNVYMTYGLKPTDQVDEQTGIIYRPDEGPQTEEPSNDAAAE